MITEKTHNCKENGRHAAMSEIPERVYEECQVQLQKRYSEESRDDNADSTDRGLPLRQYDPKLIRARSRFEEVSTPRNEWNRRIRTKTTLKQTSRTSTSKREEETSRHHPRGANAKTGYMFPSCTWCRGKMAQEKENRASLQCFFELIS